MTQDAKALIILSLRGMSAANDESMQEKY